MDPEGRDFLIPNQKLPETFQAMLVDFNKYTDWFNSKWKDLQAASKDLIGEKFDKFLNLRFGQFVKPADDKEPNAEFARYASLVQELVNIFNDKQKGMSDDMFKMFIYEIVIQKFVKMRMAKAWAVDKIWDVFVDFQSESF